jgi:hypothetical protein
MHNFAARQMVTVWIALLAVLFGALAPALSHALPAAGDQTGQVQVCTMAGMKTISVGQAGPAKPGTPVDGHFLKHCPYCAAHDGTPFPPSGARPVLLPPAAPATFPALFYRAPGPLFVWSAAHPRAPPAACAPALA